MSWRGWCVLCWSKLVDAVLGLQGVDLKEYAGQGRKIRGLEQQQQEREGQTGVEKAGRAWRAAALMPWRLARLSAVLGCLVYVAMRLVCALGLFAAHARAGIALRQCLLLAGEMEEASDRACQVREDFPTGPPQ